MTVGEKIKKIRKRSDLSSKELAQIIGVSEPYMSAYENGKRNPKEDTLDKIADALGVHPQALVDNEFDCIAAMHKLFDIFRMYEGDIIDSETIKEKVNNGTFDNGDDCNVYITFKGLSSFLFSWLLQYEEMKEKIEETKSIKNISKKLKAEKEIEENFDMWMDLYPTSEPNKEMLEFALKSDKRLNSIDRYFRDNNSEE